LSLIGTLAHASKVLHANRVFLHCLIDPSTKVQNPDYFIRLNLEACPDIDQFAADWNGVAILLPIVEAPPQATLTSDASGNWGCGAYHGTLWFQLEWIGHIKLAHISVKELVPLVIAVALWGQQWIGTTVMVLSDNTSTVTAINNHTSHYGATAHMLRCFTFLLAMSPSS